jgi:hypothetical protein
MAVASGFGRETGEPDGGVTGAGSETRTERALGSRAGADRRASSLWCTLTYALSILYSTATPASFSLSHTHLRVWPAPSAVWMSGQELRIKRPCSSVSPYLRRRKSNLSQFPPKPAHAGAEGVIPNQDTLLPQAFTDAFQRMPCF